MDKFKTELNSIYDKKVTEYKNSFDNSKGITAMANNVTLFSNIINLLADELTNKSNMILSKNENINKDELIEYSKELVLKFRDLKLNPFS
jgi:hypothetical protein